MAFASSIAKAKSRGHDIRRKLFLKRSAAQQPYKLRIYADRTFLGEIARGWNLGMTEQIEYQTGARYYPLHVDLIDDSDGEFLRALKSMTKVKIGAVDFGILSKPSFLTAVPSYTFKVQPMGES